MLQTIAAPIALEGVGLHGGQRASLRLFPARAGTGIVFQRTDVPGAGGLVPARFDHVVDTRLCTRIANDAGVSVGTIEHLMAALAGAGVTDATVRIDGPEVPIMDGSARPFFEAIRRVGLRRLSGRSRAIRIRRSLRVVDGARSAALHPALRFGARFRIAFEDAAIGEQSLSLTLAGAAVFEQLAGARTFCRRTEIEALRLQGLARGGSLQNAVVVDGARVLNPGGLRMADEFVRHKMLDAVGDLALAGAPIIGHFDAVRGGHSMTNALLRALFAAPDAWDWVEPEPGRVPDLTGEIPPRPAEAARLAV